ncbi:MAG TPA: hypothetical protein VKE94_03430 [Gemmataceae bacterium]|nr:hypothetical protein [Gemmataceae bacterium]
MRRLLTLMSGLVLLSSVLGCHTAGRCDCTEYTPCAGGCCIGGDHPVIAPGASGQTIVAEPLKTAPMPAGGKEEQ